MAKPITLLLLLAVAASQVDLSCGTKDFNITSCPITFYGRTYTMLDASFKNRSAAVCFKNSLSETPRDCLLVEDRHPANTWSVNISASSKPASHFHPRLLNINSTSNCSVFFMAGDSSYPFYIKINLHNLGAQTAMELHVIDQYPSANITVKAMVSNSLMGTWAFNKSKAISGVFIDLSGCRFSDIPLAADSVTVDPQTCSRVSCDVSASVISTVSTCGPLGVCRGNNTCVYPSLCTVTGSSVIDFFGRNHSVPDRCVYSLMKPQGNSVFDLLAVFRERRRKDVMFLDHLILWLRDSGVSIYLEQGGRVRVDDKILTLNTTAQLHHRVELSKDRTGVTAKTQFANVTVFFDGNTVHVTGFPGAVEGLCGNPTNSSWTTTLIAEKSSYYSTAGCEILHSDTADSTINCSHTTEHCNLMRQAPFTACHSNTDPEPYITACTNTLCKYPAVDGLKCQFLKAYTKACSLRSNITLQGWTSKAGCSAVPQVSCQYCSAHEFCGEKLGNTRCLCRAIFASKYKPTNTLGEPTVCTQNSATVHLAGCLLEDKGIDYSVLHLRDQNCRGHMDKQTHMVTFSFNSSNTCGMEVMMNNSQVIYKNTITKMNSSTDVITRRDQVVIDFSCYYAKPEINSVTFKIKDSSVVQQIVSGVWNYTLNMNAYTDPGRVNLIGSSTEIRLNQRIWVELKTEELDEKKVALVINSCWATNLRSPDGDPRYNLIENRCSNPDDQTVTVEESGQGTSSVFSFNMFQFSGKNREIFLHCKLELCIKLGNSCAVNCGGGARRKRRFSWSKPADGNPALITMAWGN